MLGDWDFNIKVAARAEIGVIPEGLANYHYREARDGGAYDLAAVYGVKEVLDPRETRAYLIDMLDVHRARLTNGVGEHRLEAWPTSFV